MPCAAAESSRRWRTLGRRIRRAKADRARTTRAASGRGPDCLSFAPQRRKDLRMHIGIAGIGRMGSNIGVRLMEGGHALTVWNRTPDKIKPLAEAGASVAKSPADLASSVEAVITIITNADAIEAMYHGPNGLLSGEVKGRLFIEMSTVPPEVQIALAAKVRTKGAAYVECPVSGSVIPARSGKLMGLMGAEHADAERARPILDHLCRRVLHTGPVGNGAVMKLAV